MEEGNLGELSPRGHPTLPLNKYKGKIRSLSCNSWLLPHYLCIGNVKKRFEWIVEFLCFPMKHKPNENFLHFVYAPFLRTNG
jgi:hypothetical protein